METLTLYRPVGPQELALIEEAGWRAFPPRLFHQPIFYPVLNEEYATMIARDWNVKESGSGYVTRFEMDASFVARYEPQTVGGSICKELWVPAEELEDFNRHIVGLIEVISEFHQAESPPASFCLMRLDDNGNEFVMSEGHTFQEASVLRETYEARGHKQTYWIKRK